MNSIKQENNSGLTGAKIQYLSHTYIIFLITKSRCVIICVFVVSVSTLIILCRYIKLLQYGIFWLIKVVS